MNKRKQKAQPLEPPIVKVLLKRLGAEIADRRNKRFESQEGFAVTIGISRGTVSTIERGSASYGIKPLLHVLSGLDSDPIKTLIERAGVVDFDEETVKACGVLALAMADPARRGTALKVVEILKDL